MHGVLESAKSMIKKRLAHKIKKSRLELRWSQAELAKTIGLSDRTVSAYETGRISPPLDIVEKISQQVGKPVSYFTDDGTEDYEVQTRLLDVERRLEAVKKLIEKQAGKKRGKGPRVKSN